MCMSQMAGKYRAVKYSAGHINISSHNTSETQPSASSEHRPTDASDQSVVIASCLHRRRFVVNYSSSDGADACCTDGADVKRSRAKRPYIKHIPSELIRSVSLLSELLIISCRYIQ